MTDDIQSNIILYIMKRIFLALLFFLTVSLAMSAESQQKVYVIPVHGVIDLGLSGFVERSCSEAKKAGCDLVILDIDTFGGRVDAATQICDTIESLGAIPTVAFVTGEAWSAGALISLACKTIIMSPGSSIGSAEPRGGGFGQEEVTSEKMVSAIRAKFKAVAEQNGHSVKLAEAMVDKDIELRLVKISDKIEILTAQEWEDKSDNYKDKVSTSTVLTAKDKLLNLTANEAMELGLAKDILSDRSEVLDYVKLSTADVVECRLVWSEVLVRFLTHPIVSSLLLTLGFLGLIFELKIPGWGISGTLGLIALALFFWGHYLVGLANWIEVALFLVGVGLLLLEIFVVPGFGITGISGIVLIIVSLFLALIKHPFEVPRRELIGAFYIIVYAFIFSLIIAIIGLKWLPQSKLWKKLVLTHKEEAGKGYTQEGSWAKYLGKQGITVTPLRPTGKIEINGEILDVVTEGDFLEIETNVKVVSVSGNRIVVRSG